LVKGEYCDDVGSDEINGMSKAMDATSADITVVGEMEQGCEGISPFRWLGIAYRYFYF
jgi:hypothetical protein